MNSDVAQQLLKIESSKAVALEDYISIGADIQHVTLVTKKAFELSECDDEDVVLLRRVYFSDALITYARPFMNGVRTKLDVQKVFGSRNDAIVFHKYLIDQRNKLIAHSVNPFENTFIGVVLDVNKKPIGIGHLSARLVAFKKEDYTQFNHLANTVLAFVNDKIRDLESELLTELKSYTPKRISRLKPVRFVVPGPDKSKRSKKKA